MKKCPKCSGSLILVEVVSITRMYTINPTTGVHDPIPYGMEQALTEAYTLCTECEVKYADENTNINSH